MSYPRKLLNAGEEIALDLRPHWWFFVEVGFALLLALAALIAALLLELDQIVIYVAYGLVGLAVLAVFVRWLQWTTTEFVVTTDRLIWRTGVLSKHGLEIPLERVNNIAFSQSLFERMLRSGDLVIESAGETGRSRFSDISHPARVQNEIYRQMEAAQARDAERIGGRAAPSLSEELERLDALRQRGVLSAEEFAAQKARLLGG